MKKGLPDGFVSAHGEDENGNVFATRTNYYNVELYYRSCVQIPAGETEPVVQESYATHFGA